MADIIPYCSSWCFFVLLLLCAMRETETQDTGTCRTRACYPPSEDLLQLINNISINASSTCGSPQEVYELRFVGEFQDTYQIRMCDAMDAALSHTTDFLYDFSTQSIFGQTYTRPRFDTWWQSPNTEQDVFLEVTFGAKLLFQETSLSFRSVRPRAVKFEKSNDGGQTFIPLQYYAESCSRTFPGVTETSNSYNLPFCERKFYYRDVETEAPGEDIQLVEYSPAEDLGGTFYQRNVMDYFTLSRLRIMLVQTGITTPATKSYFAVADWVVIGQCLCYGHALRCTGANQDQCECQHNTQGVSCTECKPLYNNKPWQAGRGNRANACEDCGCNGFATNCIYDEVKGYGVCQDCIENTMGDKCEMCVENFYRNPNYTDPAGNNGNTCIACDCNVTGTLENTFCNETSGQCQCKPNVQGRTCDECKDTFHNLQADNPAGCQECACSSIGSLGSTNFCDKHTGQCICKTNVMGDNCDICKDGTFNLDINNPDGCTACDCDIGGSVNGQCIGADGLCQCRPNVAGRSCNTANPGFYVPKLDGILYEAEMAGNNRAAVIVDEVAIDLDDSDNVTRRHTGPGFMAVSPGDEVEFTNVRIPRTQRYAFILRHNSVNTWSTITISMRPQNTDDYLCNGVTITGSVLINLPIGSITPAENGAGATRFGSDSSPCLKEGLYDITVTFATSSGGSTDTLLLDSLVLLPRLEDIGIFTSAETPQDTKDTMQECWDAAKIAHDPLRQTQNCSFIEFSLMAEVHNGAIACTCEDVGTQANTNCDSHGGQCECLPGVIGRSCDTCTANHYGYDTGNGCTACNCDPLGSERLSCNQTSGDCACKMNVIGNKCDACEVEHYGISTGNGCTLCTCNLDYSLDSQCDDTGQCDCKPGVGGMNCDQCASGYYNLTTTGCVSCGCNFDGIREDAGCDQNGQCVCRQDVTGEQCDECPVRYDAEQQEIYTYGFGPWSERGCLRCYCSSHSYNCTEATGWVEASVISRFTLTNTGAVLPRWTGIDVDTNTTVKVNGVPVLSITDPRIILEIVDPSNLTNIFFKSPEPYHGDKRTAYGQMFSFTLRQSTTSNPLIDPDGDVFIYSRFATEPIAASLPEPPGVTATLYNIKLHENYWKKGTIAGAQPTTEEMIRVLAGITSIQIRAKYTTLNRESVFFEESELALAVEGTTTDDTYTVSNIPAMFVESCTCPPQYGGNFCEQCAPGFRWRSTDLGPFSGCISCDCNGHSELPCDQETGACQECQHNTAGDTCQLCQDGYYGDATRGTPDDCQPCMCPGPPGENSFSPICDGNGQCLACDEGHEGDHCETCITGYYGVPTVIENNGGQCRRCFCSNSPAECDSISGQCMNCVGNTGGLTCNVCDNGYWGNIANCQECDCDPVGGDGNCTQDQGICVCHPNVIGNRCTQCAPNSWGFDTGEPGCTQCDCHPIGTVFGASQCNLETGQCQCKERVTGQKCDACINGYYSVEQGCIPCECSAEGTLASTCNAEGVCTCEVTTGQCTCMLETIAGRTCDRCGRVGDDMMNIVEEVFVGAYPNCEPCPECYQNWRRTLLDLGDNFEAQEQNIMNLMQNYGGLSVLEVDQTLEYIQGNLSYAERAIQEGTEEAGDLEAIQSGFQAIATGVDNMTAILAVLEQQAVDLTLAVDQVTAFSGNVVVEPGITKNAAQLQQELDSLVNTRETYFGLAEASWTSIQTMYELVETQETEVRTLQVLVGRLLDDTERAANDRRDARSIISNTQRDTEFGENFQRLQEINTIYGEYPLQDGTNLAAVAQTNTNQANATIQTAKVIAGQKKSEAESKAYESEKARFNATAAEEATNNARTAALSYKDVALSTKGNMADFYLTVLDVNTRLAEANSRRTQIETLGAQVQQTVLRPSEEMTTLVGAINSINVEDDVQTYYNDAAAGLQTAEEARNTSQDAQMESSSIESLKNTIENDLTQAEIVRGNTETTLDTADVFIENINTVTQQVTRTGEEASVQGHSTSDTISEIRQNAQSYDQCLISKKNQAENAGDRAEGAKLQAQGAQQEFTDSDDDQKVLSNLISSERNSKTAGYNDINNVAGSADDLYSDVITAKQMEDLDALINQYIQQRTRMQQLTGQLTQMETDLDAILANLEGASEGSIQCNDPGTA